MTVIVEYRWECNWAPCNKKSDVLETGTALVDNYPMKVFDPDGWIEHQYSDSTYWYDCITGEKKYPCLHFCCQDHFDEWRLARESVGLGVTDEH